jgi:GntR family transcriptional regulator
MSRPSELPKYAQVVTAVQQGIVSGAYPVGTLIPSEHELAARFSASRAVVVRALQLLEQDGWVQAQKGRGRVVLRAHGRGLRADPRLHQVLREGAGHDIGILSARLATAPAWVADTLALPAGSRVLTRRRLVTTSIGPVELGTSYVASDTAADTELATAVPLGDDGILGHLRARKGIVFDTATRRVSARAATTEEADLLQIPARSCVLSVIVTAYDTTGQAQVITHAILASSRMELEDHFPLD